jgi:hypothetical protein
MELYERLLEERAEEEQRRGGPLLKVCDSESMVLVRRLEDTNRRPGYATDLSMMHRLMMHRLIIRGPRNAGQGIRLGSPKAKYREEYGELRAERRGQQGLL